MYTLDIIVYINELITKLQVLDAITIYVDLVLSTQNVVKSARRLRAKLLFAVHRERPEVFRVYVLVKMEKAMR